MTKYADERLFIARKAQRMLLKDVRERNAIEACGLLLGHTDRDGNWYITSIRPMRNIHNSPVFFEFAPDELIQADFTYPGKIVGVYHSHPTGFSTASNTDRETMQRVNVEQRIPWVWLIIKGPFDMAYAQLAMLAYYHFEHQGLREILVETA